MTTLDLAANTLTGIAAKTDDIYAIIEAKDVLRKALDELEHLRETAETKQKQNRANLSRDRAELRELLDEFEQAGRVSDGHRLRATHLRVGELLGADTFLSLLTTLCAWILSEANEYGRHYADFDVLVTDLQQQIDTHWNARRRYLVFSDEEIKYFGTLPQTLKRRIVSLTATEVKEA